MIRVFPLWQLPIIALSGALSEASKSCFRGCALLRFSPQNRMVRLVLPPPRVAQSEKEARDLLTSFQLQLSWREVNQMPSAPTLQRFLASCDCDAHRSNAAFCGGAMDNHQRLPILSCDFQAQTHSFCGNSWRFGLNVAIILLFDAKKLHASEQS